MSTYKTQMEGKREHQQADPDFWAAGHQEVAEEGPKESYAGAYKSCKTKKDDTQNFSERPEIEERGGELRLKLSVWREDFFHARRERRRSETVLTYTKESTTGAHLKRKTATHQGGPSHWGEKTNAEKKKKKKSSWPPKGN